MKCFKNRVLQRFSVLFFAVVLFSTAGSTLLKAAIIFESGTLGRTGLSRADVTNQSIPGTNIKDVVFTGVRFFLDQPVITEEVGGHFVSSVSGNFFGAIVKLDDEDDFPDSGDLSTPDVLGSTLLTFPLFSDEVFGDLNLSLDSGWYALVFGSGLFGATTNGVTIRNGLDIGDPEFIGFQPGSGWVNIISSFFDNNRFVIKGSIVPEPSTFTSTCMGFLMYFFRWRSNRWK